MEYKDPFEIEKDDHYKQGKLVGGYVPRRLAEYLSLLALYKNATTQSILREIIEFWSQNQEPRDAIIQTLADRAYQEWARRKREDPSINYNSYKAELRDRLQKRKIPEKTIYEIFVEVQKRKKVAI